MPGGAPNADRGWIRALRSVELCAARLPGPSQCRLLVGRRVFGHRACSPSFNGKSRCWAAASIDGYLAGAGTEAIYEQERLTERDRYNEYLMTRLRTAEGLELATVETCFGKERAERLLRQAEPFMRVGELCLAAGRLAIPAEKFLVSDAVIGALFEADD